MFILHGMQRNTRILHLAHNVLKTEVNFKLDVLGNVQITAQLLQPLHPLTIFLIPATANQHQDRSATRILQLRNETMKSLDLQFVIFLRTKLCNGQEARFAVVGFQRNVVEFGYVARGVNGEGTFGFLPKLKYVASSPRGVHHDHFGSSTHQTVEESEYLVINEFAIRKDSVVGDELSIIDANLAVLHHSKHVGADSWKMDISTNS